MLEDNNLQFPKKKRFIGLEFTLNARWIFYSLVFILGAEVFSSTLSKIAIFILVSVISGLHGRGSTHCVDMKVTI